jgi:F-type H+-transporting ATPase subunit b
MSFFTRMSRWLAAIVLIGALLTARSVFAQPEAAEVTEDAQSGSHGAPETEAAGDPNPLAFRTDLAIWTLVVFLVLFGLLSYFAWPQIAAALDERERKITDSIAAAQAKLEEAKQLLAQHEAKLAAAAGEVRALLEEARRDAEHTRRSIAAKGAQDAKAELERALREIDRAKDGAIHELATTSADVAIDLARKIVREKLSQDEQNKLVREALVKLTAMNPSEN